MKQLTLAAVGFERYAKTTRRAVFLTEMEGVVPWVALCALIEPFYPKPGNGRPPVGGEQMLRVYFLQQWFNLSDPAVEEALYGWLAMRRFVGIDLDREPAPDKTTACRFRHLPEQHDLGRAPFDEAQRPLAVKAEDCQGYDRRCNDHQCAVFHQKRREGARSRYATSGISHEGTFRGRQPQQADPRGGDHAGQCRRQHGTARSLARGSDPGMGDEAYHG